MADKSYISKEPGEYMLRKSRYIEGRYIHASPDHPAKVKLPAGFKIDAGLTPVADYTGSGPLKPHYLVKESGHAPRPEEQPPTIEVEVDVPISKLAPAAPDVGRGGGKRPSDKSPV